MRKWSRRWTSRSEVISGARADTGSCGLRGWYSSADPAGDGSRKFPMMVVMPGYDTMRFGEDSSGSNLNWIGMGLFAAIDYCVNTLLRNAKTSEDVF